MLNKINEETVSRHMHVKVALGPISSRERVQVLKGETRQDRDRGAKAVGRAWVQVPF